MNAGMIAGGMSTKRKRRATGSTGLILILLALVALLGLLSGFLTHTLISRSAATAQNSPTSGATHPATAAGTSTPVPVTGVTGTVTASAASGQFQLSVTVTPKTVKPGQQIIITIRAFTPDTHQPVAGLPCVLRAPSDGAAALFTSWPAARKTDSTGAATWTLTAPNAPAGTYEVEAYAQTSSWSYRLDSSANLIAG